MASHVQIIASLPILQTPHLDQLPVVTDRPVTGRDTCSDSRLTTGPTCNQRLFRLSLFATDRTVRLTLIANELAIVAVDLHLIVANSRYLQMKNGGDVCPQRFDVVAHSHLWSLKQVCVCSGAYKHNQAMLSIVIELVRQQKIAADVTFSMSFPVAS